MSKLRIKIITLFPPFIENFVHSFGIVKRAIKLKLLEIRAIDLRKFGLGARQVVDDRPYGGGVGMVLRADVLLKAVKSARKPKIKSVKSKVILLTPQGKKFTHSHAQRLAKYDELILVCGRYEGLDERMSQFVDEEISVGDYVLMGGELPALTITEAVIRLRPGVLGKNESSVGESFSVGVTKKRDRDLKLHALLEYPQYTKPEVLIVKRERRKEKSMRVPKVLLTGHHKNINEWRHEQAIKRTKKRRPDLVK